MFFRQIWALFHPEEGDMKNRSVENFFTTQNSKCMPSFELTDRYRISTAVVYFLRIK